MEYCNDPRDKIIQQHHPSLGRYKPHIMYQQHNLICSIPIGVLLLVHECVNHYYSDQEAFDESTHDWHMQCVMHMQIYQKFCC